ncbi:general stress protein [Pseudomonas sp. MAFF212428]|uniref:General stress protein n=1 Tax=Pseudomonas brassicae TaxID=2708063 RepID=A0A6B3NR18_9PSED|nr:KGG domain-containing protein [Pseudomonas brassicae]NER59411.1 general stress protein [Pseudomonas brassicae]NER64153.1 general stress protein [Pseudomonas brassicae]
MTNKDSSNPGNFANDKNKASEAGKKGGHASGGGAGGQTSQGGKKPDTMRDKADKPSGGGRS